MKITNAMFLIASTKLREGTGKLEQTVPILMHKNEIGSYSVI